MHSVRAARALQQLAETDPALAVLALWCRHRDAETGLAETRGDTILYGPRFEALSLPEQVGLSAHHILHVAFRHGARAQALRDRLGGQADLALFTLAADGLINDTLLAVGYALPRPAAQASALVAEALHRPSSVPETLTGWDAERLFLALTEGSGTGRGEAAERARAYAARQGFEGDLHPEAGPEGTGAEGAADWQDRVARALAAGRQAGRGIGALGYRLRDLPETRTPWERLLRASLADALIETPRRTTARPARGWLARDASARQDRRPAPVFEPGLRRTDRRPRLAVGLDMSSSVPDAVLARFAAEIVRIAARSGAEVHLLAFDETVRVTGVLDPRRGAEQIAALRLARDGGTDFAPVLAAAAALDPAMIVVLTDLDADLPPPPGRIPVLWAVPAAPARTPGYGRVILLDG